MNKILLFIAAACIVTAGAQNPGIKLSVSPLAINEVLGQVIPQILKQMGTLKVPNTSAAGYTLTDFTIEKMELPSDSTRVTFDGGKITLSTDSFGFDAKCTIDGKLAKLIHVNFGTGVSMSKSSIKLVLSFDQSSPDLKFKVDTFDFKVKNFNIKFPSTIAGNTASTLISLLQTPIQSTISLVASKILRQVFGNVINGLYGKVPKVAGVPSTPLGVSYKALKVPVINPGYISAGIDGTFYNVQKGFQVPSIPPAASTPDFDAGSGKLIQALVTEYTVNSAAIAFFQTGKLAIDITKKMLPANSPFQLNVFWFKVFIPQLGQKYPDNTEVSLNLKASQAPKIRLMSSNIRAEAEVTITINAVSSQVTQAASFKATLAMNLNPKIVDWAADINPTDVSFKDFAIISSNIGTFDLSNVQKMFDVVGMFAAPLYQSVGYKFQLPTNEIVDLKATSLDIQSGFLRVQLTPKYKQIDISKYIKFDTNALMLEALDELAEFVVADLEFLEY